jgi:hypothetical protein
VNDLRRKLILSRSEYARTYTLHCFRPSHYLIFRPLPLLRPNSPQLRISSTQRRQYWPTTRKMLPTHLNGSFKRYKKDTDSFVSWLADTAVGCGLRLHATIEPSVTPNTATRQGPRLKGKARNQAREQTETSHPDASLTAKKLTTNQLIECAKKIASAKSSAFRVPHHMYESLLSALNLRTQCTSWFEKQE